MTKEELRRLVRSQKRMYSAPQLQAMSAEAVARLMALPQMAAAKTVMLYYSLPDEVSTHELADRLVERGKVVVLPVVTGPAEMELRRYRSADDLSMGAFGIMEPTGEPFVRHSWQPSRKGKGLLRPLPEPAAASHEGGTVLPLPEVSRSAY